MVRSRRFCATRKGSCCTCHQDFSLSRASWRLSDAVIESPDKRACSGSHVITRDHLIPPSGEHQIFPVKRVECGLDIKVTFVDGDDGVGFRANIPAGPIYPPSRSYFRADGAITRRSRSRQRFRTAVVSDRPRSVQPPVRTRPAESPTTHGPTQGHHEELPERFASRLAYMPRHKPIHQRLYIRLDTEARYRGIEVSSQFARLGRGGLGMQSTSAQVPEAYEEQRDARENISPRRKSTHTMRVNRASDR